MGMADMNTVKVVNMNTVRVANMAVAVVISTPALAIAKYPITRRSTPIALYDGFVVYA
jgi:hypothetical protein